jgi:acyl carrier protein
MPDPNDLVSRVADLVTQATDGSISLEAASKEGVTFAEIGMSSLAYLRLIDAVENEFGIYIDLEEAAGKVNTARGIVDYMIDHGTSSVA